MLRPAANPRGRRTSPEGPAAYAIAARGPAEAYAYKRAALGSNLEPFLFSGIIRAKEGKG